MKTLIHLFVTAFLFSASAHAMNICTSPAGPYAIELTFDAGNPGSPSGLLGANHMFRNNGNGLFLELSGRTWGGKGTGVRIPRSLIPSQDYYGCGPNVINPPIVTVAGIQYCRTVIRAEITPALGNPNPTPGFVSFVMWNDYSIVDADMLTGLAAYPAATPELAKFIDFAHPGQYAASFAGRADFPTIYDIASQKLVAIINLDVPIQAVTTATQHYQAKAAVYGGNADWVQDNCGIFVGHTLDVQMYNFP